jgi:hypothetical protein
MLAWKKLMRPSAVRVRPDEALPSFSRFSSILLDSPGEGQVAVGSIGI